MMTEQELYMNIADILEKHRTEQEISKRKLVAMTGITPVYIREVLRGERKPSVFVLMLFCKALGITLSELFTELEHKQSRRR